MRNIGLFLGPALALLVYFLLPDTYVAADGSAAELGPEAHAAAAVAILMAVWWMTEAIPLYATALLPLALFPLLGIASIHVAAAPYGHEIIFLFFGGFVLALAIERWELHRRIALTVLAAVGPKPGAIVAAFMMVAAFLSMWVTNTATTIMLLPVAISVILLLNDGASQPDAGVPRAFPVCLLLGIAYAANIGGIGTIVGTAPNVFVVSFIAERMGRSISFIEWMQVGVPMVLLLLPVTWFVLTRLVYPLPGHELPGVRELLKTEYENLRRPGRGEMLTLVVFVTTALAWMTRPLLNEIEVAGMQPLAGLTDTGVAMIAALVLFLIPVNLREREFLMDWPTAVKLPWGLLILFGGGLSLAAGIADSGLSDYIGQASSGLEGLPVWLTILCITAIVIFLTELTSNTATTATLVPVLFAVALGLDLPPLVLILPATFAVSCAFMLPVATPPNAIVFGSGLLEIGDMVRAGFWLNMAAIALITVASYAILLPLMGVRF